jgi:dihydrodipicolinate reductase
MLTITITVDAPSGQAIGIKEQIAMELEKFGDVRVVKIEETKPEQKKLW